MNVLRFRHLAVLALLLTPTALSFGEAAAAAPPSPIPARSRQLLLVRSAGWAASVGSLQRYHREPNANWQVVGKPLQVNLGKRGMAWGRGLHAAQPGPVKVEGDNRTPAGVFRLGSLFGYAPERPANAAASYPYIHIGVRTVCVEDVHSPRYNEIIDGTPTAPMLRADGVFRLGFVIEQNAPDAVAGAGSCVFFHVQRGPAQPTHGCTSAPLTDVQSLAGWLEPEAQPIIVELPEGEYSRLKAEWRLPD
ncbi:MAG: L,D-transpeptidase family protein [Pseudomonadota bacterium]